MKSFALCTTFFLGLFFISGCSKINTENTELIKTANVQKSDKKFRPVELKQPAYTKTEAQFIFNGDFELGKEGENTPGFYVDNFLSPVLNFQQMQKLASPLTSKEANKENQYLYIPGIHGQPEYNIHSERFTISQNGTVRISFRGKFALPKGKDSLYKGQHFAIDFRCFNTKIQYGTVKERYPVLVGKTFKLTKNWQNFSLQVPVLKGFPYALWFRSCAKTIDDQMNGVCLDDVQIEWQDKENTFQDELIAVSAKKIPAYFFGEKVSFALSAKIKSTAEKLDVTAIITQDYHDNPFKIVSLSLQKSGPLNSKADVNLYTGKLLLDSDKFGSFSTIFTLNNKQIPARGGEFVILHKIIQHPENSPGWSFGVGGSDNRYYRTPIIAGNNNIMRSRAGFLEELEMIRLSGMTLYRVWGSWKLVEPVQGQFRSDLIGRILDALKEKNLEPVFVLGSGFNHVPKKGTPVDKMEGSLPTYLYANYIRRNEIVIPPDELWRKYMKYVLKEYGDRVKYWEVINEPQWGMKPEEYMQMLKISYEEIKKALPNAVVIGNGATGDQGFNVQKWTSALIKYQHEDFLDAVAFHPYRASLDNIDGHYFKFSQLVEGLKEKLRKDTPLWCTECYYVRSSIRKDQGISGQEQSLFAASDLQRHHLLGLMHGLKGALSCNSLSLKRRSRTVPGGSVPNDVCAGMNALSHFLTGMKSTKVLKINQFLKTVIFNSDSADNSLGVIWNLRMNPSSWKISNKLSKKLHFFDNFGNLLKEVSSLELTGRPVFIKGAGDKVQSLFNQSKFINSKPLSLSGRRVDKQVYFCARNLSGTPRQLFEVKQLGKIPSHPRSLSLSFRDNRIPFFPFFANERH